MKQDSEENLGPGSGSPAGQSRLCESAGAAPFTSRWHFRDPQGAVTIYHSRHLRKHLRHHALWTRNARTLASSLWKPGELNWWIGIVFAAGAALFALGSILFLFPDVAARWSISESQANQVFFLGSIPFTTAAYLQLLQAANADHIKGGTYIRNQRFNFFGWRPHNIGWLACALQFPGTVLFNLNTWDALHPGTTWIEQDVAIWIPNILGSILFLSSGYLAFLEVCHAHWAWQPRHISWWIGFINLLGCIAFLVSAVFAFVPPHAPGFDAVTWSLWFTLLGALAFLTGALLLLPEAAATE